MMEKVGNVEFAFVNTEIKTEIEDEEDENFVSDPIDTSGNIHIKEEIDLKWEKCSVDENECDVSDQLVMSDPLAESDYDVTNDPLAKINGILNKSQAEKTCSKKHCSKYEIHPSWIEHCYYRTLYTKCENCPQNNEPSYSIFCPDCNKGFNSRHGLVMHILLCKDYKCDQCHLKFCQKWNFVNHMHHKHQKNIVCKHCNKRFEDKTSAALNLHECTLYKCDTCFYRTFNKGNMRTHIFKIHMNKNGETIPFDRTYHDPTPCPRCGKIYKNKNVIKSHLTYCLKKMIRCLYCEFETQRFSVLKQHVQTWHVKNKFSIVCSRCGKILKNKSSMKDHYFDCPQKALSCNYCSFGTKYGLCLKIHLFKLHCEPNQIKYECPKCLKNSEDENSFRSHLQICFKSPDMQCEFCDYATNNPANLPDHVFKEHFAIRKTCRMPCANCGKKFLTLNSWKNHKLSCERPPKKRKRRSYNM